MADWTKNLAGRFIVIDGPDGCGKSTQLKLLADWLGSQGVDVCTTRDPGGTKIGDRIRQILLDGDHGEMAVGCELMLYMASRAQLAEQVIRPAIASGQCVLCDRYVSSTVAYQGAGGVRPETIRQVAEVAVGGLWPDVTFVLDLPAAEGLARAAKARKHDRMEAKGPQFHDRVRELFLYHARQQPDRFAVVDASGNVEQVQQRLRDALSGWRWGPRAS